MNMYSILCEAELPIVSAKRLRDVGFRIALTQNSMRIGMDGIRGGIFQASNLFGSNLKILVMCAWLQP